MPSVVSTLNHLSVDVSANKNVDILIFFKCFALRIIVFCFHVLLRAHSDLIIYKFSATSKERFI